MRRCCRRWPTRSATAPSHKPTTTTHWCWGHPKASMSCLTLCTWMGLPTRLLTQSWGSSCTQRSHNRGTSSLPSASAGCAGAGVADGAPWCTCSGCSGGAWRRQQTAFTRDGGTTRSRSTRPQTECASRWPASPCLPASPSCTSRGTGASTAARWGSQHGLRVCIPVCGASVAESPCSMWSPSARVGFRIV